MIRLVPLPLLAGLLALPVCAWGALVTTHYATDQEMLDIMAEPHFVAESRIGNNALNGDIEIDLGQTTSAPDEIAHLVWPNGAPVAFTLSHDGAGTATFTLGGESLVYDPVGGFTDVWVRARAVDAGTSIRVADLHLDGEAVLDESTALGDGSGLDILRIRGAELGDGFVLTGTATLTWTAPPPQHSRLSFQLKIGSPDNTVHVDPRTWGEVKATFR